MTVLDGTAVIFLGISHFRKTMVAVAIDGLRRVLSNLQMYNHDLRCTL
jgi:hypothetical protein